MAAEDERGSGSTSFDVVIVGAGHNGLVAAAYLARAGLSVLVAEAADHVGGASISTSPFPGVDVRLSRYAYLVSLLPDRIVTDLGLRITLASRAVSSYTPIDRDGEATGLFIGRAGELAERTAASFAAVTGSPQAYDRYRTFLADLEGFAAAVAPSLLEPLPSRAELRARVEDEALWEALIERPLSEMLETRFFDDLVRGLVLTDGLIGTFAPADAASRHQNACFLYHVIGNGTGEWRVPVGGMGTLVEELLRSATEAGATVWTSSPVTAIDAGRPNPAVTIIRAATSGGRTDARPESISARWVLVNAAPRCLAELVGDEMPPADLPGCQVKINMVLQRLPRFRSGIDPEDGFSGTLHIDEGYAQLDRAYEQAAAGRLADPLPMELYCHSLTDSTILAPELVAKGWHTLTAFVLHTPAALFTPERGVTNDDVKAAVFRGIDAHLCEPLADCLALDRDGRPCIELTNPVELEHELGLPEGNIFHGALRFPFRDDSEHPAHDRSATDPAWRWGVETAYENVMFCGSGARRGGAVSGIGGHNAAHAVLQLLRASTQR